MFFFLFFVFFSGRFAAICRANFIGSHFGTNRRCRFEPPSLILLELRGGCRTGNGTHRVPSDAERGPAAEPGSNSRIGDKLPGWIQGAEPEADDPICIELLCHGTHGDSDGRAGVIRLSYNEIVCLWIAVWSASCEGWTGQLGEAVWCVLLAAVSYGPLGRRDPPSGGRGISLVTCMGV